MKIKWYGHSCFMITSNCGKKVLIDPYNEKTGYKVPEFIADFVLISHEHHDHSNIDAVKSEYEIIKGSGNWRKGEFVIEGIKTYHDKNNGLDRGENTIFLIKINGYSICHCGDLGHILDEKTIKNIGKIDVLIIPIGGKYTIDSVEANIIDKLVKPDILIPMHYKTDNCIIELDNVDNFLKKYKDDDIMFLESNSLDLNNMNPKSHIIVMEYV